jgi:hypothetical protein
MGFKIKRKNMKRSPRILKACTICLLLLTPAIMYSDGGFSTTCTSYKDYDSQPTIVAKLRMAIIGFKINGKTQSLTSKQSFNTPYGYRSTLSVLGTLYFSGMTVNEKNTEIIGFDCFGSFNK